MTNNDDQVENIAKSINNHRELETEHLKRNDKNLAVALSNVHYFGKNIKIWLTTKENTGGFQKSLDITGAISSTTSGDSTTYTEDGYVVDKNTRTGELLITKTKGKHKIKTPNGEKDIEIFSLTSFIPDPHKAEAYDLVLNINEPKPRRYQKLTELLRIIDGSNAQLDALEEEEKRIRQDSLEKAKENEELVQIARQKDEEKKKREQALAQVQSFIRKSAELRHQPILDPWQEEIKRSSIYNGTIAIDGGPGTGKTTALIQRIKFLLDRKAMTGEGGSGEIIDDAYLPNLNEAQKRTLFDNNRNWAFFTPNELLKLFLRDNMLKEGLKADDSRVLIWKDHLDRLVKQYKLVNPETQNPFLFLTKSKYLDESLLPQNGTDLKQVLHDFEKHYLRGLNDRLQRLTNLEIDQFSWKAQGASIQGYIKRQEKDYTIEGLIRLYFNLQESYASEVKQLTKEYHELLGKSGARLMKLLSNNSEFKEVVFPYAEEWKKSSKNIDQEDEDQEDEELEDNTGDLEGFLFGKFKILVKNTALMRYDNTVRLSKKYQELADLINPYESIESFESLDKIGQLAFFSKFFVRSTRGIVSNVIVEIHKAYKSFRKQELTGTKNKWNQELLKYLVEEDKARNKRIHPEEQALLIYFINSIISKSHKVSKLKSKKIQHAYFEAFRIHSIPVIAVDEATDFHLIDLLAMHSLADLEISSVTYSGDVMQRLTKQGIRKWDELNGFIKPFDIKQLYVSYRQSPTLLELASTIYKQATKLDAEYISYMDKDPKEPKPLLFKSPDEEEKIDWIAERILEIYHAYGSQLIPAIAIFLPNNESVEAFAERLSDVDQLADVGIRVRASRDGQVLGDSNMVRVFPIDYIKGMEFEAVFFHNMHLLSKQYNNAEMVLKHLYVGLSRATFYMAVTSEGEMPKFNYLDELFETNHLSWKRELIGNHSS